MRGVGRETPALMLLLLLLMSAAQTPPAGQWIPAALHPLSGRPKSPEPLPSPRMSDEGPEKQGRRIYGGGGGPRHLGGFTQVDPDGLSPAVWRYLMQNMTVKTVLDLGCGKGISTSWFRAHDARVLCVEGLSRGLFGRSAEQPAPP